VYYYREINRLQREQDIRRSSGTKKLCHHTAPSGIWKHHPVPGPLQNKTSHNTQLPHILDVFFWPCIKNWLYINPLKPKDLYMCRTAQLTSRCCNLNIYSTNTRTEYFKHAAHSPFFFSSKYRLFHNATFFGSCIIHILHRVC